jgi:hypothetical protein
MYEVYSPYVVLFSANRLFSYSFIPLNNITAMLTQIPLCVATHNGIVVSIAEWILGGVAAYAAQI